MPSRSQGCLLYNTHPARVSEIPQIHLKQRIVSIHLPTVWASVSTLSVHKAALPSYRSPPQEGSEVHSVFRRLAHHGSEAGSDSRTNSSNCPAAGGLGFPHQLQEVSPDSNARVSFPGIPCEHKDPEVVFTSREGIPDSKGSQTPFKGPDNTSSEFSKVHRQIDSSNPGNTPSPPPLPSLATYQAPGSEKEWLRYPNGSVGGSQGRSKMVDRQPDQREWQRLEQPRTTDGDGNGRIQVRMGSRVSGHPHRRLLVSRRGAPAHQCIAKDKIDLLKTNNATVVAYVNHTGGTRSQFLVHLSQDLWQWCLQRNIQVRPSIYQDTSMSQRTFCLDICTTERIGSSIPTYSELSTASGVP